MDETEYPMNKKLEDLMYQSGLTAQGCWDEMDDYDHQAIEKLSELIVRECAGLVENQGRFLRYDVTASKIKENFGIKK
jgi:hypothetical protein